MSPLLVLLGAVAVPLGFLISVLAIMSVLFNVTFTPSKREIAAGFVATAEALSADAAAPA
ncbi:MAG: hypothetical protein NVS3B3_05730 [Aquirhabdus sp.]